MCKILISRYVTLHDPAGWQPLIAIYDSDPRRQPHRSVFRKQRNRNGIDFRSSALDGEHGRV